MANCTKLEKAYSETVKMHGPSSYEAEAAFNVLVKAACRAPDADRLPLPEEE